MTTGNKWPRTDPNDPYLYNDEGVDLTLIRWMLSLTPAERLQTLEDSIRSIRWLCHGRSIASLRSHPKDPG